MTDSDYQNPTLVLPFITVGPVGSNYPIISTAAAGGAAATINAAITAVHAAKGGTVSIAGGPGTTYYTEATIVPLENVNISSDGCIIEAMNGATFTPIIGNLPTQSLTNLEFYNLAISANGGNSGFTAQSITTTASPMTVTYPTLTRQSTILLSVTGGTVSSITINGLTVPAAAYGSIYMTPTDTVIITWSGSPTITYTQNIDGWWTYNTSDCKWIACGQWQAGGLGGGLAFNLDTGSVQNSTGNYVNIQSEISAGWQACIRINGVSGKPTPNNEFHRCGFTGTYSRGIDIAKYSDSIVYSGYWHDGVNPSSTLYVGIWVGSAGTSGANATSQRQVFPDLVGIDASAGTPYAVVLGYYNGAPTKINRGLEIANLTLGGTYTNWTVITDLRTTPISDWSLHDVVGGFNYDSNTITANVPSTSSTSTTTITPPAIAGTYRISLYLHVTVAGTTTTPSCTWKDEGGSARNLGFPVNGWAGTTWTLAPTAAGLYGGSKVIQIDNSATNITLVLTPVGSTFNGYWILERLT